MINPDRTKPFKANQLQWEGKATRNTEGQEEIPASRTHYMQDFLMYFNLFWFLLQVSGLYGAV